MDIGPELRQTAFWLRMRQGSVFRLRGEKPFESDAYHVFIVLQTTTETHTAGETISLGDERKITPPNGFEFRFIRVGTYDENGDPIYGTDGKQIFTQVQPPTTVTQVLYDMNFEYEYMTVDYYVTFNDGAGGTVFNEYNSNYSVMNGLTFEDLTGKRPGYKFEG